MPHTTDKGRTSARARARRARQLASRWPWPDSLDELTSSTVWRNPDKASDRVVSRPGAGREVSIELPGPVVDFLGVIGVNWPAVNEDAVREFAGHVREFASNLEDTHASASSTISQMQASYTGSSYERLVEAWGHMSSSHMQDLIEGAGVVATALDVAADAIVAMKGEAIAQLLVMAATFVADQAAAVLTFGIAEAAEAAIVMAAKEVVKYLENQLVQHIMGEVIGKAVEPLEAVVEKAVSGLTYEAAGAILGVPSGGAAGPSFSMIPDDLRAHVGTLQGHADTVAGHAEDFVAKAGSVSFA